MANFQSHSIVMSGNQLFSLSQDSPAIKKPLLVGALAYTYVGKLQI